MPRLTVEDLQALIQNEEEGTDLEFKGSDKLRKDQAVALCKTVSAFANSNGGRLIFGVNANDTPKAFDNGINPQTWKQQNGQEPELWLRQMFSTKIHRNIAPPDIYYIDHPEQADQKLMIVDVEQSLIGAHQLKEESDRFAYYYRNGSQNRQMEDWQIRDVMNRQSGPDIWLLLSLYKNEIKIYDMRKPRIRFDAQLTNRSTCPATAAIITIWLENNLDLSGGADGSSYPEDFQFEDGQIIQGIRKVFDFTPTTPLFGTQGFGFTNPVNRFLTFWDVHISEAVADNMEHKTARPSTTASRIKWEIQAPNMTTRQGFKKLILGPEYDRRTGYIKAQLEHLSEGLLYAK